MQEAIIEKFPDADIHISIVWIKKLSGDSEQTAQKAAELFTDHRVAHFYDQYQIVGKEIAKSIGWEGHVAWDIYLFYKPFTGWNKVPPPPIHWMHQLKDRWADKAHFRTGDGLIKELLDAMTKISAMKTPDFCANSLARRTQP